MVLIMVAVTFLVGTLHAFGSARAAISTLPTATISEWTDKNGDLAPSPAPAYSASADTTTGVISLSVVIVVILLAGSALGRTRPHI